MINLKQKTSYDLINEVAQRVKMRRKEKGFTQLELAKRAGMSLASYKRFEQTGKIAFESLCSISISLGCEYDFDNLFSHKIYNSIDEVIAERKAAETRRSDNNLVI